ncbi:MAG: hypothetical protein K2G37_05795, partial [Clostridia bacterium]|nr:hypothetical protein [Clostridia bacterium]
MNEFNTCIMCGKNHKIQDAGDFKIYFCDNKRYKIHDSIINHKDTIKVQRMLNSIYDYVKRVPFNYEGGNVSEYLSFYYEETENICNVKTLVNVYQLMKQYPLNVIERIDKIMY